ncbi:Uncharacterised protein [Nocardia otitidiscaviarum]|uniref:DGQHR domain-containing protein n=1 Tax=Nocardia otitidiscaviarum TaxID=1823 RepID=A0A378YV49_9NOCA|nr:hypothetical protein [Nocardia otitidiscaviarum]SUA80410.1 Uncharacterised protein [Nocardia otitidiscaviarum]
MHLVNPDQPERVVSQIIEIDAAMARRMLEHNRNNRPIRQARVQQYFEDMTSSRWRFNGEAIKFGPDGELLDGQHRLAAIARTSGQVFPMLVVRGLARDTQVTMDQGARRTPADQLTISGITGHNTTLVAAALRVYIPWLEGNLFGDYMRNKISTTRIVEYATVYPETVARAERFTSVAARLKARPAVACAVLIRLSEVDETAAAEFVRLWDSGAGLPAGSPILALRQRLDILHRTGVRTSDRDQIGLIVTAWNLWRRGRSVAKLLRPKGGFSADNFPEPR